MVVALLVLGGVIGGLISVRHQQRLARLAGGDGSAATGARDDPAARAALQRLQERVQGALDHQRPGAVRADVERFVKRHGHMAGGHMLLGQVFLAEQRLPEAQAALAACLALEPDQPVAHRLAGAVCMQLGRVQEAEAHYDRGLELDPSDAPLRLHLAQCHIEQERFEEARRALEALLAADSSMHDAQGMLADLHVMQGRYDRAMAHINAAIERTPLADRPREVVYIRRKAAILRRQDRPDESLQVLTEHLVDAERRDPAVLEELATCWSMLARPAEGARGYESALADAPNDWRLAAGAARWWLAAGDTARARQFIEMARAIDPRLPALADLDAALAAQVRP